MPPCRGELQPQDQAAGLWLPGALFPAELGAQPMFEPQQGVWVRGCCGAPPSQERGTGLRRSQCQGERAPVGLSGVRRRQRGMSPRCEAMLKRNALEPPWGKTSWCFFPAPGGSQVFRWGAVRGGSPQRSWGSAIPAPVAPSTMGTVLRRSRRPRAGCGCRSSFSSSLPCSRPRTGCQGPSEGMGPSLAERGLTSLLAPPSTAARPRPHG